MDIDHYKRVVETALICAQEPLTANELSRLFVEPPLASACLLYTSPSPRDGLLSRMPSSA